MKNPKTNSNGDKWWENSKGEYHREDGPAVIWGNGNKTWYINGRLHREDGPAIVYGSGGKYWYVNGKNIQ